MIHDDYIARENGAIKTKLTVANNQIKLNSKPFQLQATEDVFADLENDASAPAQPEASAAVASSAPAAAAP